MEENRTLIKILIFIIIILVIVLIGILLTSENNNVTVSTNVAGSVFTNQVATEERTYNSDEIEIVPTLLDKVSNNSSWCGTFQLVWNDMVNEIADGKLEFNEPSEITENLNKQTFTEDDISEEYYYKAWGLKTIELKTEIENGIKEKFDETSDILDDISWEKEELNDDSNPDVNRYLFYVMLKREFAFENEFTILENGKFGDDYDNVEYFGIDNETADVVRKQVEVLYYNSETDFAVQLNTETGDKVILIRNAEGQTFQEIYDNMYEKANNFSGKIDFGENDTLKVPNLNIDKKKNYEELKGNIFTTVDGKRGEIQEAIQSIKMKLDNTGGSIKSEALIDLKMEAVAIGVEEEAREFNFDGAFTIFLQEDEKEKPYFAANITDINLFQ